MGAFNQATGASAPGRRAPPAREPGDLPPHWVNSCSRTGCFRRRTGNDGTRSASRSRTGFLHRFPELTAWPDRLDHDAVPATGDAGATDGGRPGPDPAAVCPVGRSPAGGAALVRWRRLRVRSARHDPVHLACAVGRPGDPVQGRPVVDRPLVPERRAGRPQRAPTPVPRPARRRRPPPRYRIGTGVGQEPPPDPCQSLSHRRPSWYDPPIWAFRASAPAAN